LSDDRGIKLEDESEPPPWESAGFLRRDQLPHRGAMLGKRAHFAEIVCGFSLLGGILASIGLLADDRLWGRALVLLFFPSAHLGLVGLFLAIPVMVIAWGDLVQIRQGWLDSNGEKPTAKARTKALRATLVGLLALAMWTWVVVYVIKIYPLPC
jgi:hypothetical protein